MFDLWIIWLYMYIGYIVIWLMGYMAYIMLLGYMVILTTLLYGLCVLGLYDYLAYGLYGVMA